MNDHEDEVDEQRLKDIRIKLTELRQEHHDLGVAITAILSQQAPDMVLVARMKKRKLTLKDQITLLEDQIRPDIIA